MAIFLYLNRAVAYDLMSQGPLVLLLLLLWAALGAEKWGHALLPYKPGNLTYPIVYILFISITTSTFPHMVHTIPEESVPL